MKKLSMLFISLFFAFAFVSCDFIFKKNAGSKNFNQWVYVKMLTEDNQDTLFNFYYGQIDDASFEKLKDGKTKGFFQIKNIRFVNTEDRLEIYEDSLYEGAYMFRFDELISAELLKTDPILNYNFDSLAQNSKEYYLMHKKK